MTDEIFKEAKQLYEDINTLKYHLEQVKEKKRWITIATPFMRETCLSKKFQRELVKWLEDKLEDYEIKFAQLRM